MGPYLALVSSTLDRDPLVWSRIPRDKMAAIIAEYKYLAESTAGQYGSIHWDFASDSHVFLFENADAAVQFSFKLIESWKDTRASNSALSVMNKASSREMPARAQATCTELMPGISST